MQTNGIPYLDLMIVVVLVIFIIRGFNRGFTEELIRIIGTIVSLILAIKFMSNVSQYLIKPVGLPPIAAIIIAFIILFIPSIFLFKYIATKIKEALKFSVALGGADKIFGGALGLFKGAIVVSLVTIFISIFSFTPFIRRHITQSALFDPMRRVAPLAYETFKVFMPHSNSFFDELEENVSGVSIYNRGDSTDRLIEYYRKK